MISELKSMRSIFAVCSVLYVQNNCLADLFVESVPNTTAGVSTNFEYISSVQLPTDGDFFKAVFIVNDFVIAESLTSSGTLSVTFDDPGTINYIVRTYRSDGTAIDSVERSIIVFGVGMIHPDNNDMVPLGSRLFLAANAVFSGKDVNYLEFEISPSGTNSFSTISGSRDFIRPFSMLWEPPFVGVFDLRAVAHHSDGAFTYSTPRTLQVSSSNIIDNTYVTILDPSEGGSVQAGVQRTISVDVSTSSGPAQSVSMYIDGVLLNETAGPEIQFPFLFNWIPQRPGSYKLVAIVKDNRGRLIPSDPVNVTATDDRPHVEVILPANGSSFERGKQIPLVAIGAGQGGAKERVGEIQFLVNGNLIGAFDTHAPYVQNWTPEFTGSYFISARVIDSVTQTSYQSPSITVNITAATEPTTALTYPYPAEAFYAGEQVTLRAVAADNQGVIRAVEFWLNDVFLGTEERIISGFYEFDYTFNNSGTHTFRVRATNDANRQTISAPVTVNVEQKVGNRPTIQINSPSNGSTVMTGDTVAINALVNDTDGNISEVLFYSNRALIGQPATTFPFRSTDYVIPSAGQYLFEAVAVDNDGNRSTRAAVSVRADDPVFMRPEISITSPENEQIYEVGNQLFIEAQANDADGNIREVRFSIDGNQLGEPDTLFPYQSEFYQINSPGVFRVEAIAVDNEGNQSLPVFHTIYAVPPKQEEPNIFDPVGKNRDFVIQTYIDFFSRGPSGSELNRHLQNLDFGNQSRAEMISSLLPSAEFQNLLMSHNAYHMIIGDWPDPIQFSSVLQGLEVDTSVPPTPGSDDVGDTINTATKLTSESPIFSGNLEEFGDVDLFSFDVSAETLTTVSTTGAADTVGALYAEDGFLLEYDDDSGELFNFIIQRALTPGKYFILVAGWAGATGSYTLNVSFGQQIAIPRDSEISNVALNSTINFLFSSEEYVNRYGPVRDIDSDSLRRNLFAQLYKNRFREEPTLQQLVQGSSRMQLAKDLADFTISFLRNDKVGLNDYIYGIPNVSDRDESAFLVNSLLKSRATDERVDLLRSKSFEERVEDILNSDGYRSRFIPLEVDVATEQTQVPEETAVHSVSAPMMILGSSLEETGDFRNPFSNLEPNENGWKYIQWFGWFSDQEYPWVFHEKLGWIKVHGSGSRDLWIWSDRWEWAFADPDYYPTLFRYNDETWIRLNFGSEPGDFSIDKLE